MYKTTKLLPILTALILVSASLAVWAGGQQEPTVEAAEEKPLEKAVVFVRTGIEADAVRAAAEAYTKKTGNPIEIMEAGRRGFYATVHTQLIGGSDEFDLAQANNVDVAVLAAAGAISPIEPYLYDPKLTDLAEYDLDDFPFVYRYDGKIYTIPFDVSTHFLYYRSDLIPNPPQTWNEYLETARKWTQTLNPSSPTMYGASLTALAGSEQPKVFYSVMWSKGGWILDDKGKELLNLMGGRVRRMHSFIDGILNYSRLGRVKEKKEPVDINVLLRGVIDSLNPPDDIQITIEENLPEIECDGLRIAQIFQNLLDNAIGFMDKAKGSVKVECFDEDSHYKFAVSDNGPGIKEKHYEKVFQMFQTLTPRDKRESTGVGLAIAKKVVETYKGKIWLESAIGEGSTFFFTLPKTNN